MVVSNRIQLRPKTSLSLIDGSEFCGILSADGVMAFLSEPPLQAASSNNMMTGGVAAKAAEQQFTLVIVKGGSTSIRVKYYGELKY